MPLKKPKIIVVTGAESTGKSSLTEALAQHYHVPFIPEIARKYVENLNQKYTYHDVECIAKQQVCQLEQFKKEGLDYVFIDTWLFITKVWFDVVFNKEPEWLNHKITSTHIDLFLVCDTDLPWIYDPVRENGGENRIILQKKYIELIQKYNFNFERVNGVNEKRLCNAIRFVEQL